MRVKIDEKCRCVMVMLMFHSNRVTLTTRVLFFMHCLERSSIRYLVYIHLFQGTRRAVESTVKCNAGGTRGHKAAAERPLHLRETEGRSRMTVLLLRFVRLQHQVQQLWVTLPWGCNVLFKGQPAQQGGKQTFLGCSLSPARVLPARRQRVRALRVVAASSLLLCPTFWWHLEKNVEEAPTVNRRQRSTVDGRHVTHRWNQHDQTQKVDYLV